MKILHFSLGFAILNHIFKQNYSNMRLTKYCKVMTFDWKISLNEDYSPVHKQRKFLLVLGQISEKS